MFEQLRTEVGKLGGTDYSLIEKLAREILGGHSKDIRAISFLALALAQSGRWEETAEVFDGFATLAGDGLSTLFPERPRARDQAIAWLAQPRIIDTLDRNPPSGADHTHVARICESLNALKGILERECGAQSPFPEPLAARMHTWFELTAPKAPSPTTTASAGAPTVTGDGTIQTPAQTLQSARRLALTLIEQEPAKPAGYRILRCSRWDALENPPPSQESRTQVEPPPAQTRAALLTPPAPGQQAAYVLRCEKAYAGPGGHLWLDLQRLCATACDSAGEHMRAVSAAIILETRRLVERVPDLLTLSFSDGTAFADSTTRAWLDSRVAVSPPERAVSVVANPTSASSTHAVLAADLAAGGKLDEALACLTDACRGARAERERFELTICAAGLLLDNGKPALACAALDRMLSTAQPLVLERWDPDLTSRALALQYRAARASRPATPSAQQAAREHDILGALFALDPHQSFTVTR